MKQRILIVDDHVDVSEVTAELLEMLGYASDSANSLDAALHLLRTHHFDAVISDLHMPAGDGMKLRSLLAEEDNFRDTPFVYMTGKVDDIPKLNDPVLVKPFSPDDLVAVLEDVLNSKA
ncbi:response regulator [Oxalicibacterium faecigallinarum]|uniref:Response regulatory domain-containing protein n=1 Tax=Oxalicibacterium faecigallinarum TaxID=573741 RepID=A0A8J3AXZ4_9BURK|nr:response regulator [Oxalicibacterium faecigallinarum]GGI18378.1 hypothetical protein GCM10008066_13710 [Oxalicibacterium faecigallinarum]